MLETGMRTYATGLTEVQWALVGTIIPEGKPGGRPRSIDVRAVVNAIFYLLRTGCQWRLLPREFPPWPTRAAFFSLAVRSPYAVHEIWSDRLNGLSHDPRNGNIRKANG